MHRVCASCGDEFEAKRSTAKFCSPTCRQRARRGSPAAAAEVEIDAARQRDGGPEHVLVATTRRELETAGRTETFAGQLALQLAKRLADPEESGVSALSKELRTVMAAALEGVTPPSAEPAGEPEPVAVVEDALEKARRKREETRQAAGLA